MRDYRKQTEACFLGKNIGGILGTPFEGFPIINNVSFYDPVPTEPVPNDDIELQVMYAAALEQLPTPQIAVDRLVLAEIWKKHFSFYVDEYTVALRNLFCGIMPPWSGKFDNCFSDGMGAAIRSEFWACLAPENPALAAKFAYEDSCIDHSGNGVDAEVFLAALESLAFGGGELPDLIQQALQFLDDDSGIKKAVRDTLQLFQNGTDVWKIREFLLEQYGSDFRTCVLPNVPFCILALLEGRGDFGKTICLAVNFGMDTDCTAATAGAVLGILDPDCITEKWLKPAGRTIAVRKSAVHDLVCPKDVDELCRCIERLRTRITPAVTDPDVPEPDYPVRHIEYAVICNCHWYEIHLDQLQWKKLSCGPTLGKLELGMEHTGNLQVILKIPFYVPETAQYTLLFNSPTSNQCYLDPASIVLHDDRDMLFGRMRLWDQLPENPVRFPASTRPTVFSPTLGGAPLNQYRRYLELDSGNHLLYAALEPDPAEKTIVWGFDVGITAKRSVMINNFSEYLRQGSIK